LLFYQCDLLRGGGILCRNYEGYNSF
jgi:hypothetical protein